jgi:hypothetical protein
MKLMKRNRNMWLVVMSLILLGALPSMSLAQGRGRGQDKKLDKFVNGHDARDGRWDGRGPNRRAAFSNTNFRQRRTNRFRYQAFERNERLRDRRFELRRRGFDNYNSLRAQRLQSQHRRIHRRGFYQY